MKRSQRSLATKDNLKNCAMKECVLKEQIKSTINIVATTLKKMKIMENESMSTSFSLLEKQMPNSKAQEYLKL